MKVMTMININDIPKSNSNYNKSLVILNYEGDVFGANSWSFTDNDRLKFHDSWGNSHIFYVDDICKFFIVENN